MKFKVFLNWLTFIINLFKNLEKNTFINGYNQKNCAINRKNLALYKKDFLILKIYKSFYKLVISLIISLFFIYFNAKYLIKLEINTSNYIIIKFLF